ncbi:MAG: type II toxin-antitoxin system RelB/DinJ family antitoxin [bacterium]|nr:type II toxin-antitoxin system RelB/DinJ family antitoxin [bacterium]
MAKTTAVYARIDTQLKDSAEEILAQLGITPTSAIQMLYSQIVLNKGLPFELRLPYAKPTAIGAFSREELDIELAKGVQSLKEGALDANEVDARLSQEFGI